MHASNNLALPPGEAQAQAQARQAAAMKAGVVLGLAQAIFTQCVIRDGITDDPHQFAPLAKGAFRAAKAFANEFERQAKE